MPDGLPFNEVYTTYTRVAIITNLKHAVNTIFNVDFESELSICPDKKIEDNIR
jgi:hypothetical protein